MIVSSSVSSVLACFFERVFNESKMAGYIYQIGDFDILPTAPAAPFVLAPF